jgi:predicted membrane channel-forming protein YqfA (hemolysin III family)
LNNGFQPDQQKGTRNMHPQKKFHLVFSMVMGAMMIFIMTFVITLVNVGLGEHFVQNWMKAFGIAYVVGVPVIFFLAPVARKLTGKLLGVSPA